MAYGYQPKDNEILFLQVTFTMAASVPARRQTYLSWLGITANTLLKSYKLLQSPPKRFLTLATLPFSFTFQAECAIVTALATSSKLGGPSWYWARCSFGTHFWNFSQALASSWLDCSRSLSSSVLNYVNRSSSRFSAGIHTQSVVLHLEWTTTSIDARGPLPFPRSPRLLFLG